MLSTDKHHTTTHSLDPHAVAQDFPILTEKVHCRPLVYLDNAATTQKPRPVIEAIRRYYADSCSNIHRGVYRLSMEATDAYQAARKQVQHFLNAESENEIIFVRGATEAINLVAQTFGRTRVGPGDEVLVTHMEHHANIVPWQLLCQQIGATLKVVPVTDDGELALDELDALLSPRVRLLGLVHVSNALGTLNPVQEIIQRAHDHGIPVLVDGAQAVPHLPVDVRQLDCDFYTFSGHKVYGPTGVGVLYGKYEHLDSMPPYQGGGDMIVSVTFDKTLYQRPPARFEAGTPHIAGAVGLAAALDYVTRLGFARIARHEADLLYYALDRLQEVPGLRVIGRPHQRAGVVSFVLKDAHPHDIGTILDQHGVAIRAGHHCAQPLMQRFDVPATTRASFAVYNTRQDVDALVDALHNVREVFS